MFFKNPEEIKAVQKVSANFKLESLKPYIEQVETQILIPLLCQVQYDDLHGKYQANTMSDDEKILVEKIQKAIGPIAFATGLPELSVTVSDLGVHIHSTENIKQAFQWQLKDLAKSRARAGYTNLEQMLLFLEAKKLVFTAWASSDAYTEFKECYLNTAIDFRKKGGVNIHDNRLTFLALKPFMLEVEETHILSMIGQTYTTELKNQIKANTLTTANQKAVDLIQKAVAHLTIAECMPRLECEITVFGYVITSFVSSTDSSEEQKGETDTRLSRVIELEKQKGELYLSKLRNLLYSSATDYATFTADTTVYVTPPTDGTTSTQFNNNKDNKFYFGG
jgi:hypothetical protein